MSSEINNFEFGEFFLDAKERVLWRRGKILPITPKVFGLLFVLVENHGRIVEKNKLMETVWADSFVEESNLTFTVRQLRKILGDQAQHPRFIETVPKRGYRFIAEIKTDAALNPRQSSSIEATSPVDGWRLRPILISTLAVAALGFFLTTSFLVWHGNIVNKNKFAGQTDLPPLKFETVTSSERPITAAISPDGKFVAYIDITNNQESLWLRQLASGINTQIVAPTDGVSFQGIEFSHSGEYVYLTRRYRNEPAHIDRVSIFGGAVKTNILSGVDGAFGISPDDRRISFRRYTPQKRSLLVADIDGSNEREILTTTKTFTDNVFSLDGKTIAFASGQSDTGERDFGVYTIDAAGGDARPATDFKWFHIRSVVWLSDQSGLLVTARTKLDEPHQLWKISLSDGEVKKITDTQNDFVFVSAAGDLSQILLTQVSRSATLYLASSEAPDDLRPVAQAAAGVAWTPEGNLVYSSPSGSNDDIWLLSADRANRKQLTTEDSADFSPKISPDGRYVVFVSDRGGKNNLWRLNADGGDPIRLTDGEGEQSPVFTADGQFVAFNSMKDLSLWRVSIEGGASEKISGERSSNIAISPDGTKFAHFSGAGGKTVISIGSFPDGDLRQEIKIPEGYFAGSRIVWSKDGDALIYSAEDANSVGNLWRQPLAGDALPQKITDYNAEEIFYFDYSPDGSQLALIRGSWNHMVVLASEISSL